MRGDSGVSGVLAQAVGELPGVAAELARGPDPCSAGSLTLCVPKTPTTLCDQVRLVDQATDARPSSYAVPRKIGRLG